VFKTIRAKVKNSIEEESLMSLLWSFLSPPNDDYIIKELLYDFLAILMDRTCDVASRVDDLKRLEKCIGSVNDSSPKDRGDHMKLIKEFENLMDRRKVLGFRRKEDCPSEKMFSFQPETNKDTSNTDRKTGLERLEALYHDFQEKEDKILSSKLNALEAELSECTFTPCILEKKFEKRENCVKEKEREPSYQEALEAQERKECTFHPSIIKNRPDLETGIEKPRGFEKFVEMQRKAQIEKLEKIELESTPRGENYEKFKNLKPCPPSFLSRQKEERQIKMYIDVNLGQGRKGKIAIREQDDPDSLASNFCKIFHLSQDYEISLSQEIKDQLKDL
jgi:hypothetical protein